MVVMRKNAKGEREFSEMALNDVVKWMREHSDKEGNILDEIMLFTTINYGKQAEDGSFPWVMSDFTVDRDQEKIDPLGWDLKHFKKNPVLLWSHNWMIPAIGKVLDPHVEKQGEASRLIGRAKFDPKEIDPFAAMIGEKVRIGTIKAGSVGFRPVKVEIVPEDDEDAKAPKKEHVHLIYRKQELYEFSACNIPSNPSAMVEDSTTPEAGKSIAWSVHGNGERQLHPTVKSDPPVLPPEPVDQPEVPPPPEENDDEEEGEDDLIEASAIPYADHGVMPEGEAWDGPAQMRDATPVILKVICAWYDSANPDIKGSYKLPHHLAASKKAVWKGVAVAMGALLGSRGGVSIPDADRKAVYNHLAKHYAQFEKEPPAFKTSIEMALEEIDKRFDALDATIKASAVKAVVDVPPRKSGYLDDLLKTRGERKTPATLDQLAAGLKGEGSEGVAK